MKTDKELLELAAKAAGISFVGYDVLYEDFSAYCKETDVNYLWNPLDRDGDALRLAVKLGFDIMPHADIKKGRRKVVIFSGPSLELLHYTDGSCAGLRKAIVKLAADIGENL